MLGASKNSYSALIKAVDSNKGIQSFNDAKSLLAAAKLIATNKSLLNTLTDSGISNEARSGIAKDLLNKIGSTSAIEIIAQAVTLRWSDPEDLVKALEESGFRAAFAGSENSNELDRVEDEIFAFERAIAASGELELMLADPNITSESRLKIINDLVGKTFTKTSIELVNYALGNRHGRSITTTLKDLSKLAADRRGRLLAEITTAIALSADQETRLVSALKAIYKQDIQLKKVVDKKVIGGVAVRIGDEVIDGTVSNRIAQIKRELAV